MNVLVDTSVWADHFRTADRTLIDLLDADRVVLHPFVLGELSLGNLRDRRRTITAMMALPACAATAIDAFLESVDANDLAGSGLGFVDANLVTAAHAADLAIWTRDKRLATVADRLGLAWRAD